MIQSRKAKRFEGKVRLSQYSGLRKLARAMRRGKLDDARAQLIAQAEANAKR
jgi:hypothetical protein